MSKFEKKFGRFAIPNLTGALLLGYAVGYVIMFVNPSFLNYLTLDVWQILHGQVWRLITWVIVPPYGLSIWLLFMLLFYYNIGTALERTWGTWQYNVYIFRGILFTVIAGFLALLYVWLTYGGAELEGLEMLFQMQGTWGLFGTYYICLSIYLAFAATYPETRVLFMFFIPIKIKWLGILNLVLMVIDLIYGHPFTRFAVGAALLNFLVFYLFNIRRVRISPKQVKRKMQFQQDIRRNSRVTRHKCAVCGRTDEDDPGLEFRFCSKCNGNYEYCQNHLFTHEHVK